MKTELPSAQQNLQEATALKTNISNYASTASKEVETIQKATQELNDALAKKDELFNEFESQRKNIENLMANATKMGLAKSFQDKRKSLSFSLRGWIGAFTLGISILSIFGYRYLLPLLQQGTFEWEAILTKLLITSPIIWFTWFSARQYSHTLRIREDYAFKETSAMAFTGYRAEVATDEEMLKLLQYNAISNFGANPINLLLKHPDAASPLNDILDKTPFIKTKKGA